MTVWQCCSTVFLDNSSIVDRRQKGVRRCTADSSVMDEFVGVVSPIATAHECVRERFSIDDIVGWRFKDESLAKSPSQRNSIGEWAFAQMVQTTKCISNLSNDEQNHFCIDSHWTCRFGLRLPSRISNPSVSRIINAFSSSFHVFDETSHMSIVHSWFSSIWRDLCGLSYSVGRRCLFCLS